MYVAPRSTVGGGPTWSTGARIESFTRRLGPVVRTNRLPRDGIRGLRRARASPLGADARSQGEFVPGGNMVFPRAGHTATLLNVGVAEGFAEGVVFVAGGRDAEFLYSQGEVYTPSVSAMLDVADPTRARVGHEATLLADGRVLLTGGQVTGTPNVTNTASIFDPSARTWTAAGSKASPRFGHTATLLVDGRVLIVGGVNGNSQEPEFLATNEIYDPVTNRSPDVNDMNVARSLHTATLLNDGRVLIAAGGTGNELFDPTAGTFAPTGALAESRGSHTATLLRDGTVLVVGGFGFDAQGPIRTAERYDPATGGCSSTGQMSEPRYDHTATRLGDGSVLVTGGHGRGSTPNTNDTAEIRKSDDFSSVSEWRTHGSFTRRRCSWMAA